MLQIQLRTSCNYQDQPQEVRLSFLVGPDQLIFSSLAVLYSCKSSTSEVTRSRYILVTIFAGVNGNYAGYFGAGSGSMTIVILMQLLSLEIKVAQAMKNLLIGIANGITAAAFIFSGQVHCLVAIPLATNSKLLTLLKCGCSSADRASDYGSEG